MLLDRDCRLSLAIEKVSMDAAAADASNYGIDLAVAKIFISYRPDIRRWEQLQHPNDCWLICKSRAATRDQPSQTVHINLLDGSLRVDGQLLGGLPPGNEKFPELRKIFHDVCTCAVSDVLRCNPDYCLHGAASLLCHSTWSRRNGSCDHVIRAQGNSPTLHSIFKIVQISTGALYAAR